MRGSLVILAAIVALGAAVTAIAPASLAGVAVERASSGAFALADSSGTVWRGRGTLVGARTVRLPLAWSIDPWPLLRGELRLQLLPATAADPSPHAKITSHRDAITLRDVDVTLPADVIEALAPRSGIRIAGDIRIATPSFDWTPATANGSAQVDWRDARFAVPHESGIRLGTVSATLAAAGDRLSGPLANEGGDFDVRGTLSLAASGALNISVTMTPRGGHRAQTQTLSVSGNAGGAGLHVEVRVGPQ